MACIRCGNERAENSVEPMKEIFEDTFEEFKLCDGCSDWVDFNDTIYPHCLECGELIPKPAPELSVPGPAAICSEECFREAFPKSEIEIDV